MLPNLKDLSAQISRLFLETDAKDASCPIWLAQSQKNGVRLPREIEARYGDWLKTIAFEAKPGTVALLPGEGVLAGIVASREDWLDGQPTPLFAGSLPALVPPGDYHLEWETEDGDLAALGWALGQYAFKRYRPNGNNGEKRLRLSKGARLDHVVSLAAATWLARDLINTPANDLGPGELEDAVRGVASHFGADCESVVGDDLLSQNFPLIHAVGRASAEAPRLIDLRWGREDAPKITIVGKGICFDTGGLDIKPSAGMAMMKKDMGGAATALALAAMIMAAKLPIRLRLLIPAAENAISGNSFRTGDVLKSRAGIHVEVGNTDAEGRLVLADALALADEEAPDHTFSFATLTGSARVALGPDLPPVYSTDTGLVSELAEIGRTIADPMWPMPLWQPYDQLIESPAADINSIAKDGFAGSIIAALFLKRFVKAAKTYTHFDIYGWVARPQPARPVGGDPQCARAVLDYLKGVYPEA
jgi:leucyl aminopeptidase